MKVVFTELALPSKELYVSLSYPNERIDLKDNRV